MSTFIILAILILILIGLISKLVKKTREVRASFRDTFGGGADQTRENATNMVIDNSKGKVVPQWAVSDAAKELTKYNLADSQLDAENQLNMVDYIKRLLPRVLEAIERKCRGKYKRYRYPGQGKRRDYTI